MANYGHKHQHKNDQIDFSQFDDFMKEQFAHRRQRELSEFDGLARMVSQLAQRGTQVAILSLGRSAAANEWLGKDFDTQSLRAMNEFCETNQITRFDPIVIDDPNLYRDPTHVNDEGAVLVSKHLLEQISKLGLEFG